MHEFPAGVPSQPAAGVSGGDPFRGPLFVAAVVGAGFLAFGFCLAFMVALNSLGSQRTAHSLPQERTLFFFTASWCPASRHMEPIVADLQSQGLAIRKIDVDSETALAEKFDVESIPTFVLLENGSEARREVGEMDRDELAAWFLQ